MDSAAVVRHPAPSRFGHVLALLGVLLVAGLVALVPGSDEPLGTDAPADVFSAARAGEHIDAIATAPRPLGSTAHTAARDHLVAALDELGWTTRVDSGVGWMARPEEATQRGARVQNILATRDGTDPTGTVMLVAHYDTVRGSPGAGDDGIGVGTVLEVARALDSGPPPRNDVVVLLTDGEENGLLGAHRFVGTQSVRAGPVVVLNHEARGNAGTPTTFRITSPNGVLIDTLAGAPGARADSLTELIFEALPNDTDFRRFAESGHHALDTAISAGSAYYHSPLDTPDRLSRTSLQHMGETSLATTRALAASDLAAVDDGGDQVVTTAPWGLLHMPRWAEVVGAVVLGGVVAAIVVLRVRRGETPAWQVGTAVAVSVLAAALAAGAAWLPWWFAQILDPGMAAPVADEPYRPGVFQFAAVVAALGVLVVTRSWWSRGRPAAALTCGAFVLVAVLALIGTPFPGVPLTLSVLMLPAALGLLVALLLPQRGTVWPRVAITLGALGSLIFGLPAVLVSFDAGLLYGAPVAGLFVAFTFAAVLPLCEPLPATTRGLVTSATGTAVILVVCTLLAGYLNRDGATDPRQEYLWYSLDADRGAAVWGSPDSPHSDWSRDLLTSGPDPLPTAFPWREDRPMHHGPAPVADLEAPEVEILEDTIGGSAREIRLRLTSRRDAQAVGLWIDSTTAHVHGATVDGFRAEPSDRFGFLFWAPGPDGIEVELTLSMRENRLGVRLADLGDDLGVVPGFEPPADRVVVQPTVAVTRTLQL
ncbi:M28 family peptidase [Rhodococcus sp. B50]|uniref:M28 family peptidase n=1 Tax=Rhodococcus sp. B50 TaxID=2682847 RepID=UPI001BD2ACDE|nr:M28 family peptidase [Rhodococcus sp. B50]MBS9373607.1 Aminopeptidase YwaD [Rhodococcus sp. B50]